MDSEPGWQLPAEGLFWPEGGQGVGRNLLFLTSAKQNNIRNPVIFMNAVPRERHFFCHHN